MMRVETNSRLGDSKMNYEDCVIRATALLEAKY